jgi:hypothetical protein
VFRRDDDHAVARDGANEVRVCVSSPAEAVREDHDRPAGVGRVGGEERGVLEGWDGDVVEEAREESEGESAAGSHDMRGVTR